MDREIPKEEVRRARRRTVIRGCAVAGVAVVALVGLLAALRTSYSRKDIRLSEVDRGTIESTVNASGKVMPAFEEIINSPITTRIEEVYCKVGDSVDVGTPLLRLDLQSAETDMRKLSDQMQMKRVELQRQRVNAEAALSSRRMQIRVKEMEVNRMEVNLANERYLDSLGSGTGDRVREAEFAYSTGCLALEEMRQQLVNEIRIGEADARVKELEISILENSMAEMRRTLDDARIRAPRRATLTFINSQVGQQVGQGERIAMVSDLSHYRVEGSVADMYADRVTVGARAMVRIGRHRYPGVVTHVEPQSVGGVILFSVALDDDSDARLRSGLKTDVYVSHNVLPDVLRISNGPYYTGPGTYELYVLPSADATTATRRSVRLGDSSYDYVEVESGLEPGEQVIVSDNSVFNKSKTIKLK